MDKDDLTDEDIESLRAVANSDLPASWIAERLCESFNIDTPETTPEPKEPTETNVTPTVKPENEPEGSIFAY